MSLFDKILEKLGLNRPAKAEPIPQVPQHFRGRIRRENWVSCAKEEQFKKYGDRL